MKRKLLVGDKVMVLAGQDKGKVGDIVKFPSQETVIVTGVNERKKTVKKNPNEPTAENFKQVNLPIHISNLAIFNQENSTKDKIIKKLVDGKKVRHYKSTDKPIVKV